VTPQSARKRRSLTELIAETAPEAPPPAAPAEPEPVAEQLEPELPPVLDDAPRKYTMTVGVDDDERARDVVTDVVKRARIRPRKAMRADVIRALFLEAEASPGLRAKVAKRLRDGMPS
jgi:hypothetical protein